MKESQAGDPATAGILFTPTEFASVAFLLDSKMTEARSHRIFQHILRGIRESDDPVDIAWALAQAASDLISQADGGEAQTMVFRNFMAMILMVEGYRKKHRA